MAEVARRQANAVVPLLLLAVLLLALLAFNLRNLDRGAEQLPPPPISEPTAGGGIALGGSGDALRMLYVGTMATIALIVGVGVVFLKARGVKLSKLLSVWDLLGYALATTFLVLVFVYWPDILQALQQFLTWTGVLGGSGSGGAGEPRPPLSLGSPSMLALLVAVAIVTVYALAFAVQFLPKLYGVLTYEEPEVGRSRRELARAVRTAIADLEAGEDFRAAVLRCYKTMVLLFEARGMRQEPSQTAREFEADALRGLGVSQVGIEDLTSLFEEARYSAHEIGARQRDTAIECLNTIRAELEGKA